MAEYEYLLRENEVLLIKRQKKRPTLGAFLLFNFQTPGAQPLSKTDLINKPHQSYSLSTQCKSILIRDIIFGLFHLFTS